MLLGSCKINWWNIHQCSFYLLKKASEVKTGLVWLRELPWMTLDMWRTGNVVAAGLIVLSVAIQDIALQKDWGEDPVDLLNICERLGYSMYVEVCRWFTYWNQLIDAINSPSRALAHILMNRFSARPLTARLVSLWAPVQMLESREYFHSRMTFFFLSTEANRNVILDLFRLKACLDLYVSRWNCKDASLAATIHPHKCWGTVEILQLQIFFLSHYIYEETMLKILKSVHAVSTWEQYKHVYYCC